MRRARFAVLALVVVAAAYPVAALQTPPGFYEGFCPPVDYKFLKPPPSVKSSKPPAAGHEEIKVVNGVVQPGFVATKDDNPQAQLSFVPGAFTPPPSGPEVIDITSVTSYPDPTGITVVTNVYDITSSTPMVKPSNLRLLYSTLLPAPSAIYTAQRGGTWTALPSNPSSGTGCSDITAQVNSTGLFMAGYPSNSTRPSGTTIGGSQLLPIIVALAILIVVLAGIPLAVLRRRRPTGAAGGDGVDGPGPPQPPPGRT